MNFIDFIKENKDYIQIEGIFLSQNLTIETIEKNYGFFRELVSQYLRGEIDSGLSRLISGNPNVTIDYLFQKLTDKQVKNSKEVFFTDLTIANALKLKNLTLNDYFKLQKNLENYSKVFEKNGTGFCERLKSNIVEKLYYTVKIKDIEKYPEIFNKINGNNLSDNTNLTLEFIQNHPEILWDYRVLCMNSALTILDLYKLKEHTIKKVINDGNEVEEWKYTDISRNPNLVWCEPLPEGIPNIEPNLVYCKVNFETLDIKTLNNFQIKALSWNKKLPLKLIIDNPEIGWDYHPIFLNGNYPIDELVKLHNAVENSRVLSYNCNVHWTDLKRFPQIHWNLQAISWNHHNGPYILYYQKTKITRWIKDKYYGYLHAMATWIAYEVKKSWWSPENKIANKLRENAFKLGKLKDWY